MTGPGVRPRIDEFDRGYGRLTIVDAAGLFAAATARPVDILDSTTFAPGVRRVRITLQGNEETFQLTAEVHSGRGPRTPRPSFAVLGQDPVGALLTRRARTGDPTAIRVVAGIETAVAEVSRRLGRPAPTPPEPSWDRGRRLGQSHIVIDQDTGLRITVSRHALPGAADTPPADTPPANTPPADDGRIVTLEAAVPVGLLTPTHLAALFDVVVEVIGEVTGNPVAGPFVLGGPRRATRTGDDTRLDQVGGLDDVVAQFREIAISFRHPQAMARWGARRPQGILLYGPPGTGKTMLARALAHEIGGTLREIRTPEILDKWLGASERNLKRIFREARQYRTPTVLLFDEFDSIISYAGSGVDSGSQAVNAVAGLFKQEMNDLIDHNPNVIVVATTNFPDLIDDSLTRSGRFDVKLEIRLPDAAGRAQIITRMVRDLIAEHEAGGFQMFADDIDIPDLAQRSAGLSGADLREVLRRAQLAKAMQEARTGRPATPIDAADLQAGIAELRPQ